ncbi:hypothetical protein V6U90_04190 [Micromonospora sp. CPCC 206060]|uniref:hypothetical protein n=1 Tax=Micromonospora sp. CPCC 206060 TaxID=3122406 RepID=UPI002FF3EF7D
MADTIAETVDLLYMINQEKLTADQQIAFGQALPPWPRPSGWSRSTSGCGVSTRC